MKSSRSSDPHSHDQALCGEGRATTRTFHRSQDPRKRPPHHKLLAQPLMRAACEHPSEPSVWAFRSSTRRDLPLDKIVDTERYRGRGQHGRRQRYPQGSASTMVPPPSSSILPASDISHLACEVPTCRCMRKCDHQYAITPSDDLSQAEKSEPGRHEVE